ncbi:MAG: AI-2E family transporter [Candidatus Doudnabacteria bacterium]|nr:AI-2E family transporter [Candidatus Doudnabacteria bacterium]
MQVSRINIKDTFFIILLVMLGLVLLRVFAPFMDIIVIALIVVQLFYPIFKYTYYFSQSKGFASILSTILVFVFVFIPLLAIIILATTEVVNLVQQLAPNGEASEVVSQLEEKLRPTIQEMNNILLRLKDLGLTQQTEVNLPQIVNDLATRLQDLVLPVGTAIVSGAINVLFYLFLLTLSILYLFVDFDRLPQFLTRFSPLDNRIDKILITKFTETTRAVIIGNFLVAFAQATAVIVPMIIMQVGAPVLLWISMVLLSLVPVGAGLIFAPVGALLIISGRVAEGTFLIVYGAIIINVVDAALRPRLMKGKVQLHPLIIIFSVIGGISAFGPIGIIYGPLIAVFFTSLIEVYNLQFNKYDQPDAKSAVESA